MSVLASLFDKIFCSILKYVVHDSNVNFMLGREHWNINYIHSTQPLACWWPKSKYTESTVTLNTMHNKRLHSIWTMDLLYINKTTCGTAHGIGDKICDVSNCRPKLRQTVFGIIFTQNVKLLKSKREIHPRLLLNLDMMQINCLCCECWLG